MVNGITVTTTTTQGVNNVETLSANAWQYNVPQDNCGSFALGPGSEWIKYYGDSTTSGLFLELGHVTDQSFTGYSYTGPDTTFYAGAGDYSTIFNSTGNAINLKNVTQGGQFLIQSLYFGQNTTG